MNAFSGEQLDVMVKYMKSFLNLARLCPEIEQTDLDALNQLISYIKDDTSLAPESITTNRLDWRQNSKKGSISFKLKSL